MEETLKERPMNHARMKILLLNPIEIWNVLHTNKIYNDIIKSLSWIGFHRCIIFDYTIL